MDKKRAEKLLGDTFKKEFDSDRFSIFISELFNKSVRYPKNIYMRKEYWDYVEKLESLGTYPDLNNKIIEVFIVKLKKSSSRDRARTMQRNLIAYYLKLYDLDGALVAFYGEENDDWRFSFVKMEYDLIKNEKGDLEGREKLTPATRYSFLVGKNEPNHTCESRFAPLIEKEDPIPSLKEIETAFSVEKVTKEFFNKYKDLYVDLKKSLEKVIKNDPIVNEEFKEKSISSDDFAKKLMGQIVFIYFLQKKGWLGVKKEEKWGQGPKDFLNNLYLENQDKNFFNDVLEYLFYEALATDRSQKDDMYDRFNCKIPFLNGGLFEPMNGYNWEKTKILIDNEIFKEILKTFNRYNFTVKEDEPLDRIVAVDPEMLGKVFEKLLDVKDKKVKGAFYTPREVVHYMCQQSLINYLNTNLNLPLEDIESFILLGDFTLDFIIRSKVQKSPIYILPESIRNNIGEIDILLKEVKIADPAVGSGAFPVGMMNEIVKARSILSLVKGEERTNYDLKRETIMNSLYCVDIDSSAVDITKLRFWLSLIVDESSIDNIKPLPNLDHKIMCGNSLIDEYEGIKLFNDGLFHETFNNINRKKELNDRLDFLYIQQGMVLTGKINDFKKAELIKKEIEKIEKELNLLSPAKQDLGLQPTLYEKVSDEKIHFLNIQKKIKRLDELNSLYFNEDNKEQKEGYRSEIESIQWYIIEETLKYDDNEKSLEEIEKYKKSNSKPFFIWSLYFPEIFLRDDSGFDIIIGNPPYKSNKGVNEKLKSAYLKKYDLSDDLYNYFFLKSFELLKESGTLSFITSNTYFTINSKLNLRELFQNNLIIELIDIANVFEDPEVEPAIIVIKKEDKKGSNYQFTFKDSKKSFKFPKRYIVNIDLYREAPNRVFFTPTNYNLKIYAKFSENVVKLLNKYWNKISNSKKISKYEKELNKYRKTLKDGDITLLGLITEGGQGLATGDNGRFVGVLEGTKQANRIKETRPEKLYNVIEKYELAELTYINSKEETRSFLNKLGEYDIRQLFDNLKNEYGNNLFGKGYLFRIISNNELFDVEKMTAKDKAEGIFGDAYFVPYDKGDKDGNRWHLNTPYCLDWSHDSVKFLKANSGKKGKGMPVVRNSKFYFREGFCWNNVLNPNSKFIKCRLKSKSVHDVASMSLFPVIKNITAKFIVCLLNSTFIFHYQRNFVNNTVNLQMNDFRQFPIIVPSSERLKEFEKIFDEAYKVKKDNFTGLISNKQANKMLDSIQNDLDSMVYELYGINAT